MCGAQSCLDLSVMISSSSLMRPAVSKVAAVSTSLHCMMAGSSGITDTLALKLSGWKCLKILFLI
jgi:hypothetical protein